MIAAKEEGLQGDGVQSRRVGIVVGVGFVLDMGLGQDKVRGAEQRSGEDNKQT